MSEDYTKLNEFINELNETHNTGNRLTYKIEKSEEYSKFSTLYEVIITCISKNKLKFIQNNFSERTFNKFNCRKMILMSQDKKEWYFDILLAKNEEISNIFCPISFIKGYDEFDNKKNTHSEKIWKYHQTMYGSDVLEYKNKEGYCYKNIIISGDAIFNFNLYKFRYFENIINQDGNTNQNVKAVLKNMLRLCAKNHNLLQNCGIIIKTGGLNNYKQGVANDRADVFVKEIYGYYCYGDKLRILENGCTNMYILNRNELEKNLDLFGCSKSGFYEYMRVFYHLDSNNKEDLSLIDRMKDSGSQRLNDCKSLFRYMCLAFAYWENISRKYKGLEKNKSETDSSQKFLLNEDIDEFKFYIEKYETLLNSNKYMDRVPGKEHK